MCGRTTHSILHAHFLSLIVTSFFAHRCFCSFFFLSVHSFGDVVAVGFLSFFIVLLRLVLFLVLFYAYFDSVACDAAFHMSEEENVCTGNVGWLILNCIICWQRKESARYVCAMRIPFDVHFNRIQFIFENVKYSLCSGCSGVIVWPFFR